MVEKNRLIYGKAECFIYVHAYLMTVKRNCYVTALSSSSPGQNPNVMI